MKKDKIKKVDVKLYDVKTLRHEIIKFKETNSHIDNFVFESLNVEKFNKVVEYVEYLAANMEKMIAYSEYLADNLDKSLDVIEQFQTEKAEMKNILISLAPELKKRKNFQELFYGKGD